MVGLRNIILDESLTMIEWMFGLVFDNESKTNVCSYNFHHCLDNISSAPTRHRTCSVALPDKDTAIEWTEISTQVAEKEPGCSTDIL